MRIVHISDLHTGRLYSPSSLDPEIHWSWLLPFCSGMIGHAPNALIAAERFVVRMRSDDPSTVVALTGDLTAHGHPSEFGVASSFMGAGDGLALDQPSLEEPGWQNRTVPGNHDSWGGTGDGVPKWPWCVLGKSRLERRECSGGAPFVGDPMDLGDGWTLRFLGIDTDRNVNAPKVDTSRRISASGSFEDDLRGLARLLPQRERREIRVLMLHHCAEEGTLKQGALEVERPFQGVSLGSAKRLRHLVSSAHISSLLCGHLHTVLLQEQLKGLPVGYARCGTTSQQSPDHVAMQLLRMLRSQEAGFLVENGEQWTDLLVRRLFRSKNRTLLTHDLVPDGDRLIWSPKTWVLDSDAAVFRESSESEAPQWVFDEGGRL